MSSSTRTIVRSEFLHYRNPARNSDKIFNIFLVQNGDDNDFDCISEHGRRGSSLVRVIVSSSRPRPSAESDFERKLNAKLNHRQTPYERNPAGPRDSRLASEFFSGRGTQSTGKAESRERVLVESKFRSKPIGVLNREQFDSLEL
jgi:hypothetical protein